MVAVFSALFSLFFFAVLLAFFSFFSFFRLFYILASLAKWHLLFFSLLFFSLMLFLFSKISSPGVCILAFSLHLLLVTGNTPGQGRSIGFA